MICVYEASGADYTGLGLCALTPSECTVEEQAGGLFQLKLTHPMDATGRWWNLQPNAVLRAPAAVRETPALVYDQTPGQTITRDVYTVDVNTRLRLRSGPGTSYKIIGRYKDGTQVLAIETQGNWARVVVQSDGASGWMSLAYLDKTGTQTEVIPPETSDIPSEDVTVVQTRDQLFRISQVTVDDAAQAVYVTAPHITYDLAGMLVMSDYAPEGVSANAAVAQLVADAGGSGDFHIYCSVTDSVSGEYGWRSLLSALMETDGIVAQTGARLVRDNFDVYILPDAERDRGVEIRRGKNMLGAQLTRDVSDVVNRVVPVGKNAEGEDLYLSGTIWVDSPNLAGQPVIRAQRIEYDVKVGDEEGEFATEDAARAELQARAEAEFTENGIDGETVGLDVDVLAPNGAVPVPADSPLQSYHIYDTLRVVSPRSGISARVRMTGCVLDCLTRRYESVMLGELTELRTGVSGFDISGGISGSKLIAGSVGGDRIREASIGYAHIRQAAIEQLNADAFTAVKAHINELDAGSIDASKIDTASLNAAVADIATLMVGSITADNIETDQLAAVLGEFITLYSDYAGIDFADIKDMTVDEMIFRVGVGTELFIDRLVATNAFLASATLGNLIVRGEDGNYYRISVQSDGTVITTPVELTDEEIAAGETNDGKGVVDSGVDIPAMNGGQIAGSSAVISTILTDALTAGKITAGQALIASAEIPELYTTAINAIGNSIDITANSTIQMLIGVANDIRAWYTFSEDGLEVGKAGSTYSTLTDDTGFHILQLDEKIGSFAKRRLITEAVQVGPVNASGMRIVMRSAYDGGVIFVPEEVS